MHFFSVYELHIGPPHNLHTYALTIRVEGYKLRSDLLIQTVPRFNVRRGMCGVYRNISSI